MCIRDRYKCVPLKASIGTKNKSEYDLFNASSYSGNNIDLEDKLQSFVSGENAKFGEVPYDFQYVWNSIFVVSYTHLDVYKRQVLYGYIKSEKSVPLAFVFYIGYIIKAVIFLKGG